MYLAIAGTITALIVIGFGWFIRFLAERSILWVIIPANCYGLVAMKGNKTGDMTEGGGGVVDIVHNIPGKRLKKEGHDLMEWKFVSGEESRSILFWLLGVEWIGIFRTLRTNKIRRFRYSKRRADRGEEKRREGEPFGDYFLIDDDLTTEYVPFSGEQAIAVLDAETQDILELNFLFNVIEESTFPLKSIRVADPNGILAVMVKQEVNAVTGPQSPDYFIKASPKSTKEILDAARLATTNAKKAVGKEISEINLISTDMDEKDRTLFELAAKTKRENEAAIAVAEKDKKVQLLANDADADRVTRVILPAAANELVASVRNTDRNAEAYEKNKTMTTLVIGQGALPTVPVGAK